MLEKISLPPSVVILESQTARRAVLFSHEVGITHSSFEGDYEIVTNSLQHGDKLSSSFGHLIIDVLFFVGSLKSFSFSHSVNNVVAHALVRSEKLSFSLFV